MSSDQSRISDQSSIADGSSYQACLAGAIGGPFIRKPQHDHNDTRKEMKSTEDFLAAELSKISFQERLKAFDDLHCVGEDLEETPEQIVNSLLEFDRILEARNDLIYEIATSQNPAYVEDPSFRLRFLRANNHDAQKSVNQMIAFLTRKEKYFGRDKLSREITLNDLKEEDLDLLRSGVYHIQDGTDRNGRIVVFFLNHAVTTALIPEAMIRVNYFVMFSILSPLQSVQRKGIVLCYYDMSTPGNPCHAPEVDKLQRIQDFVNTVPIRRSAAHLCLKVLPDSLTSKDILLKKLLEGFQQSVRTRARVHYGSDVELQHRLGDHGVSMNNMPVDTNGNIRRDIYFAWLYKYAADSRLSPEAQMSNSTDPWDSFDNHDESEELLFSSEAPLSNREDSRSPIASPAGIVVVEPTHKDVLLGRGKASQNHPGNVRFREILARYQEEYNNTPRYKRVDTPKEITRFLLEDGVRFLQRVDNGWLECDASEAEKRVKQLFRNQKKSMTKKVNG